MGIRRNVRIKYGRSKSAPFYVGIPRKNATGIDRPVGGWLTPAYRKVMKKRGGKVIGRRGEGGGVRGWWG